ncbi:hypothetical protein Tco_0119198 [Tanacetum coccineum]
MVTYLKHMGKYTHNQLKSKIFEEIQKLYEKEQKWMNDFVHMDSEVVRDSGKKDDSSSKQAGSMKKRAGEHLSYWKITRADGSSKFYKVFSTMLEEFDR